MNRLKQIAKERGITQSQMHEYAMQLEEPKDYFQMRLDSCWSKVTHTIHPRFNYQLHQTAFIHDTSNVVTFRSTTPTADSDVVIDSGSIVDVMFDPAILDLI